MNSLLLFIHIPKAGGSTLATVLARQFLPDDIISIDGRNVISSINRIKDLPVEIKTKTRCVEGHMPFGLHTYFSQTAQYITLLRNPIDRIISHYYFVKQFKDHYLYKIITEKKMNLEKYATSDLSSELSNGQTRLISGHEKEQCTLNTLSLAKKNLAEYFTCIGLTEFFDESLVLLVKEFGWKNIYYLRKNVNVNRPGIEEISQETIDQIQTYNEFDIELYKFAKQMFNEAIKNYGKRFRYDVSIFRIKNRMYQLIHKLRMGLK